MDLYRQSRNLDDCFNSVIKIIHILRMETAGRICEPGLDMSIPGSPDLFAKAQRPYPALRGKPRPHRTDCFNRCNAHIPAKWNGIEWGVKGAAKDTHQNHVNIQPRSIPVMGAGICVDAASRFRHPLPIGRASRLLEYAPILRSVAGKLHPFLQLI